MVATSDRRTTPLRIAVVNDFEVVVLGVAAMLRELTDLEVVDATTDEPDRTPIDIALYDTFGAADPHMTQVRGLLDRDDIRCVAVYTSTFTDEAIERALEVGAAGYLSKSLDTESLADALRRLASGETVVSDPPSRVKASGRWPGEEFGLTEKESDVLALVVRGLDNRSIAEALYISPDTLKSRIRKLYRRIDAANRVDAVLWGIDHGFRTDCD